MNTPLTAILGLVFLANSGITMCAPDTESRQRGPQDTAISDLERQQELEQLLALVKVNLRQVKDANFDLLLGSNPMIGKADASLVVLEFADFQCGFCRRHMADTMPRLIDDFVRTGRIRYVFYDYPIESKHPLARQAAEAARCAADQGQYWKMRQHLYQNQKALHRSFLAEHARSIGLDSNAFQDCLASNRHTDEVAADLTQAKKLRIRGTPAFFLGYSTPESQNIKVVKRIDGAASYPVFHQEIGTLLAGGK